MIKIRLRRSLLFVPANRPELFDKALAGPADMICIELEDGVGPEQKDLARENMLTLLAGLSADNTRQAHRLKYWCASTILKQLLVRVICQPFYLCRPVQSG